MYFDSSGSWSGGGHVFVRNATQALSASPLVGANDSRAPVWVIPRNVPARRSPAEKKIVLIPQNAWPWAGVMPTPKELPRYAALSLASRYWLQRADAAISISPAFPWSGSSHATLENVLDTEFEELLLAAATARVPAYVEDSFVAVGSLTSYRNFARLVDGYDLYRRQGGARHLCLVGTGNDPFLLRQLRKRLARLESVHLITQEVGRSACISYLERSYAAVFPSLVEASPVALLEALATTGRVAVSRIPGHLHLLQVHEVDASPTFDPRDPTSIAVSLHALDAQLAPLTSGLSTKEGRTEIRSAWGRRFLAILNQVLEEIF